jgi:hypothetical protein
VSVRRFRAVPLRPDQMLDYRRHSVCHAATRVSWWHGHDIAVWGRRWQSGEPVPRLRHHRRRRWFNEPGYGASIASQFSLMIMHPRLLICMPTCVGDDGTAATAMTVVPLLSRPRHSRSQPAAGTCGWMVWWPTGRSARCSSSSYVSGRRCT